jgi:hypothetical protein
MRALATLLVLSLSLLLPVSAMAQGEESPKPPGDTPAASPPAEEQVSDSDKARADKLFNEGRELMGDGKYDEACAKFADSHKIRPGIGVLFNLADCNEKRGRVATAYKQFTEVAERTKAALQTDREKVALERVAKLEPKVMRIRIIVPSLSKVKAVRLDGQKLPAEDYNKPLPLDPGEHTIGADTVNDDGEPFEETIELSEEGKTVTVTIPVAAGAKMKRRVPMIIGGGVTAGIGVLLLGGGAYMLSTGDDDAVAPGAGLIALSIVHMAVGFPIFGVGFKKKPVREERASLEASPIPTVGIGPTGGSLTWTF